ncbi:MAG: hypothetical protein WCK57_00710 [Verrucomicrobiae bacterium]
MNTIQDETNLSRRFVDETNDIPEPDVSDQNGPGMVPFVSPLKLTLDQEERMLLHVFRRKEELEKELGRNMTVGTDWISSTMAEEGAKEKARRTHFGKRDLFELTYNNDVTWRAHLLGDAEQNIFATSNLTAPISRRITRQMVARANNYFFGTDPWLAAYPVGAGDAVIADKADKFAKFKLEQCEAKHVLEKAVELAFVRGESIVKTSYERKEHIYTLNAEVLVGPDGKPVIAMDGDYILKTDLWTEEQEIAIDPQTMEPGEPTPTGRMVLKRDGQTPQPDGFNPDTDFAQMPIKRRITIYKGPRIDLKYFKDFLCPMTAPSVQDADLVCDLYDLPVSDLVDTYMRQGLDAEEGKQTARPDVERLVSIVREMASESSQPKSAQNQPKNTNLESNYQGQGGFIDGMGPVAEIAEFHFRFDADGDGIQEEIFLVADVNSKRPLYYDYEANMTPDGLRPYDVIRVNEVDGRWYGQGSMEMFKTYQEVIDLLLNRWNVSQTQAGRVTAFNPAACFEGDSYPDLKLNRGNTYTLKKGFSINDLVSSILLVDVKFEQLKEQMDFFLQMAMNESGVQHANDGAMVGLDTQKLATGIRNIEKSGQEMFSIFLSHLEPGCKSCLRKFLKLLFARMDMAETFKFFEGKVGTELTLSPEEVGDLDMDVDLEMTRYRGEQQLQSNLQAAQMVTQFYQLPPVIQERVAPLYVQMLKALQIQDSDNIIAPLQQGEQGMLEAQGLPPAKQIPAAQGPMAPPPPALNL